MAEIILKLAAEEDWKSLRSALNDQTADEVAALFMQRLGKEENSYEPHDSANILGLLRAIYKGSPLGDPRGLERRDLIMRGIMEWLVAKAENMSSSADKMATDLTNYLNNAADELPVNSLIEAVNFICETLQRGDLVHAKLFDFLPKLVVLILGRKLIVIDDTAKGNTEQLTGEAYANFIISRICTAKWPPTLVVTLANIFREIPLTDDQTRMVVEKVIKSLSVVDVNEIPPLVYQLFLLSQKGYKHLIIKGVISYFDELDQLFNDKETAIVSQGRRISFSQLCHMEGTAILHLSFAVKQDQALGADYIKFMKAGGRDSRITPFNVACLLSIARIHRFESTIMDFLKGSVVNAFKDQERLEKSQWIAELSGFKPVQIWPIFHNVIRRTVFGWDQTIQSLVRLGFLVIDYAAAADRWGKFRKGPPVTPNEHTCVIGVRILLETFKLHSSVRMEVLDQCIARIMTKSNSAYYFVELLSSLTKDCPQLLLEYLPRIRETLDYLCFMSLPIAEHLMKAVQPLIYLSASLRDGLLLVLRKGMFSKELDGRLIALSGFLEMLRPPQYMKDAAERPSTSTQLNQDLDATTQHDIEALWIEILGMLRRCFSQQSEVRVMLYRGLDRLIDINPELNIMIFEILYQQFQKFYVQDLNISTPFRFEECVNSDTAGGVPKMTEPIHHLLSCLCKTVRSLSTHDLDVRHLAECRSLLVTLAQRFVRADVEDYELDKSAEFNAGIRNNIYADMLLGCYEVMMEHISVAEEEGVNVPEIIGKLMKRYKTLIEVIKEKTHQSRTRRQYGSASDISILHLRDTAKICHSVFTESKSRDSLGSNVDYVRYLTSISLTQLSELIHHLDEPSMDLYESSLQLAHIYAIEFIGKNHLDDLIHQQANDKKKDKNKSILSGFIDCFTVALQAVITNWEGRLCDFLTRTLPKDPNEESDDGEDLCGRIGAHLNAYQQLVIQYISDKIPLHREAIGIVRAMQHLYNILYRQYGESNAQAKRFTQWLVLLCKEHTIDEQSLIKALLSLLLTISKNNSNYDCINEIALDVLALLGDVQSPIMDDMEEEEPETEFSIVTLRTALPMAAQLLVFLEENYEELEWCCNYLRISLQAILKDNPSNNIPSEIEGFSAEICRRLRALMLIHVTLERTNLQGMAAENVIRSLRSTHKALHALVKFKLLEGKKFEQQEFADVIALAGGDLSKHMYEAMGVYGQRNEEGLAGGGKKSGKKGGSGANLKLKAKAKREGKLYPDLVFRVEMFEKSLIDLSKKTGVNYMKYLKRSTARDFRILTEHLVNEDKEGEEDAEEGETQNAKRRAQTRAESEPGDYEQEEEEDGEEEGESLIRRKRTRQM
ncbi:uncharacterized protein VTP21DRAFT_6651 [Calcarisporiella thermophila]|uniref:uncharacterized protein n=1 Tax=Calcarisporiella thermophila TaxID=911321 RepID=UPI00374332A9